MASPLLERLLHHYQQLGVAPSTRHTYRTGVKALQQFCKKINIAPFPASALTLCYFCCSLAQRMSHNAIKVYLAGIRLEHVERNLPDPTQDELLHLLYIGIRRSQGDKRRTRLPITISILCLLKTQLRPQTSFSLLEKCLLWAAFTLAFYGFLRASEFATNDLTWLDLQMGTKHYSLLIRQSKTDSFCHGHILTIYE